MTAGQCESFDRGTPGGCLYRDGVFLTLIKEAHLSRVKST